MGAYGQMAVQVSAFHLLLPPLALALALVAISGAPALPVLEVGARCRPVLHPPRRRPSTAQLVPALISNRE